VMLLLMILAFGGATIRARKRLIVTLSGSF
jgi:hypothetical protein